VVVSDGYLNAPSSAPATLRVVSVNAVNIAVLNDVHMSRGAGNTNRQFVTDIANHLGAWPQLIQNCGDIEDAAVPSKAEAKALYEDNVADYLARLASASGARSYAFGNSDTFNPLFFTDVLAAWPPVVSGHWLPGLGYGSFDVGGVHVILLDAQYGSGNDVRLERFGENVEGAGHISAAQLTWLQADLAATTKPSVVFSHQTLSTVYPQRQVSDWIDNQAAVRAALEAAPNGVLAAVSGPSHMNDVSTTNGIPYVIQTSTYETVFDPGYTVHDGAAYMRLTVDPDTGTIIADEWENDSVKGWRLGNTFVFP